MEMSKRRIAFFTVSVQQIFCFWASQTGLILCKGESRIQLPLVNNTQEGLSLPEKVLISTQKHSMVRNWNSKVSTESAKKDSDDKQNNFDTVIAQKTHKASTLADSGNTFLMQDCSRSQNWDNPSRKDKEALQLCTYNHTDLPAFSNLSRERKGRYGRILSSPPYPKKSMEWVWVWPRMGMKNKEASLNVSCATCNITSTGVVRKEKSKSLLSQLYDKLFVMTHARLHPMHHRPVRVIIVDQQGHGHSRTVQGAIDMVRLDNKWRIQIIIRPGTYREKVYVPYGKPFITFQGSGTANTMITWNARASDRNPGGQILGTFGSASVAIDSDYFVARDITFQNTSPPPLPGAQGMQAVALRVSGDKAAFIDCKMLGAQDTLFDHVGRHFFLRCYIEGAIDFIFGNGRSLYLNCELHANAVTYGAIAASQRNAPSDNTGFSFVQCKITGTGLLYLGRAWGPYARILFAFCYFDNIIIPDGWYDWGDTSRRETVFFGEYKCWGPGAHARWRVSWSRQLSYQEARPFLSLGFINGHKWFNILT